MANIRSTIVNNDLITKSTNTSFACTHIDLEEKEVNKKRTTIHKTKLKRNFCYNIHSSKALEKRIQSS